MSKSEEILAFEAALKESKELQEKFAAAKKRIVENNEAYSDVEVMVMAAAELGFTLAISEVERAAAQNQELNDDDLEHITGGFNDWCWSDYGCFAFCKKDNNCSSSLNSDVGKKFG